MRRGCFLLLLLGVGCTAKFIRPTSDEVVAPTPERLARGEYLVNQVSSCGACHSDREGGKVTGGESSEGFLAGGVVIDDGSFSIPVPNITSDDETGVGRWTDDQLMRAIRDGVRPDKRFLFPIMPYASYQHMSDEDVRAIVVYLRSVPKVRQTRPVPPRKIPFFARHAIALGVAAHAPAQNVSAPGEEKLARGRYVSRLAHCWVCHSMKSRAPREEGDAEFFGGSDVPLVTPGLSKAWAPNLTRDEETGLGRYGMEGFKRAIREGHRLDGKRMAPPMALYLPHISGMKDEDLDALAEYLWSLPPVKKKVPERELTDEGKRYVGEP